MKNLLQIIILILFGCTISQAQEFRLNGYTGYTFNDRVNTYNSNIDYYEGTIKGNFRWGIAAECVFGRQYGIELMYLRQDTKAPVTYYNIVRKESIFDVAANWITLGGIHYLQVNEMIEPYGGLMAGIAIFGVTNPDNLRSESITRFGWGAKLGTNVYVTKTFGLKFQADIMSAVQSVGGGLYFGTGGPGAAINTYSTMLQFNIGGGLVFRIQPKP